eukprot:402745_1
MLTPTTLEYTVAITWTFIYWFIFTPSLIYYALLFYRLRHISTIKSRHYRITLIINCLILIYILLEKPSFIWAVIHGAIKGTNGHPDSLGHLFQSISDTSYTFSGQGFVACFVLRAWIMFFNTKWSIFVLKGQWAELIEPNGRHAQNFFIQKKATFGNERWVITHIFIPIYILIIILSGGSLLFFNIAIHYIIDNLLYVISFITFIVLWIKLPKYNDHIGIKHEMRLLVKLGACGLLFFVTYAALLTFFLQYQFIIASIFQMIFAIIHWLFAMISTYWVLKHYHLGSTNAVRLSIMMFMSFSATNETDSKIEFSTSSKSKKTDQKQENKNRTLFQILCDEKFFDAYAIHIFHEFASESLLCVIECMQLKWYIIEQGLMLEEDVKKCEDPGISKLKLAREKLPKSVIVFDEELTIDQKIRKLIAKYILDSAEYEVNISYLCRERLKRLYYNRTEDIIVKMDIVQWYNFFDTVICQLIELLGESAHRFTLSDEYKSLLS